MVYARLYCARGQAENLIKLHKSQLKSDRTSCRSPLANQMRLILHTAAYWLMLTVRDAVPKTHALARAEFATLRLRVLKVGARIRETAHRVRIAFAAACPEAALFRDLARSFHPPAPAAAPTSVPPPKVGPLAPGPRWSVARKREVVLRLLRGESVELLSRELGVPLFKLEQWCQKADAALDGALKGRDADTASIELNAAMQRVGELSMEVELLRARIERPGPLARRRSR